MIKDIYIGSDPFLKSEDFNLDHKTLTNASRLPFENKQQFTLKEQVKKDIGFKSEPLSPLDSSYPTDRTMNKHPKNYQFKNSEFLQNTETTEKNALTNTNSFAIKTSSLHRNNNAIIQNKDLQSHLSSFESLNDIGSKVRSVYNGIASTPVYGRAETTKNQSRDKEKRGQLPNNFSQQVQISKDGIQIQLLQSADNQNKLYSQTPKVSQEQFQGNGFQPSSKFFYESIKDIHKFSKQDKRFQLDSQIYKNNQEMALLLKQDDDLNTNSTKRSQNMLIQGIDRSKHNWGRPVTEQKKRFVSLDQPNNEDIYFENKNDEEAFYRKNDNLFNRNFLGKQLALNNKTCLKKLLKDNANSKDIKFDQKVYDKFQQHYRSKQLQNIVYENYQIQNTQFLQSPIEKSNQLNGRMFQNQQSPLNSHQNSFTSYSDTLMSNNGFNSITINKKHNNQQSGQQISSQYFSNQNIDKHQKNDSKYDIEFQQLLKDTQQENSSNNNKWKYNMNIQSKRIQDVQSKNVSSLKISSNQLSSIFNNQHLQQNEPQRKFSSSQFQSNGDVQLKSTQINIPSIGALDYDLEVSQTRLRNNSQPFLSTNKKDFIFSNKYKRSSSIKGKTNSFEKDQQDSSNSFGDTSRKFTKILEENDEYLQSNVKGKPQKKQKKDIENKPRAKSTFEQSLQETISKQIGVDLKSCMPKKIKRNPVAQSEGRKNFSLSQRELNKYFDELRNFFQINFLKDYSYKLILSETELSSEKFIDRFLLFLQHCLNSDITTKNIPSTLQSPTNNFYLSGNFQSQLSSTPLNKHNTNNNFFDKTIEDKQFQIARQKIGSKGGFRLSTSSQQALRNIFTDLKIPIQFQNIISEDVIEIFKNVIQDDTQISIFSEQLRNKMLSLLTPKHIIQELGGKLNAKRLFSQVFQHMKERHNINIEECYSSNIRTKQNSMHTARYNSTSSLYKLDEDYFSIKPNSIKSKELNTFNKQDFSSNKFDAFQSREFKQSDDIIRNKEEFVLEQIILLLNNEIRSFDNDKNIFNFDYNDFFFFKLSIQCVLERQGLYQNQIYKLLEKIEQNREYLCKQEKGYFMFEDFANKRQIALQLQEYSPITDYYTSTDLKNLSNSFILLENILEFISNKMKTQAFTIIINKKFKPNSIQSGILSNILNFAKQYILPQYIDAQQTISHPLLLQLQRKLEFIEHQSQKLPSQIWLTEKRQQQWNEIYKQLQNSSKSSVDQIINDNDTSTKQRQQHSESIPQINSSESKYINAQLNIQNDDPQKFEQLNLNDAEIKLNQLNPVKPSQNQHTCLTKSDNITFLKYIFDFSFSFFDIYSAFDIELGKKQYQINKNLFDKWMNIIKQSLRQLNYPEEEINHQILYFKKYSLLYQ